MSEAMASRLCMESTVVSKECAMNDIGECLQMFGHIIQFPRKGKMRELQITMRWFVDVNTKSFFVLLKALRSALVCVIYVDTHTSQMKRDSAVMWFWEMSVCAHETSVSKVPLKLQKTYFQAARSISCIPRSERHCV